MSKSIVNSVLGVLFDGEKVVLTKRRDIPVWVLPGGAIDSGETAEEAILREIKEETGYEAKIEKKVALYTSNTRFIQPVYLFKLTAISKKESFDRAEVKDMKAFALDALPRETVPFYKDWIKDAQIDKPFFEKKGTSIPRLCPSCHY
ncbi:NUDIX domain-containing protein [bacterium]|nr:NUDIX domain-containing protein [bacterium]